MEKELKQEKSKMGDTMRLHIIPRYKEAEAWAELAEKENAAFEYNEFFMPNILDDEKTLTEVLDTYKALPRDRSMDTLHGVFFDIVVNSADAKIRAVCQARCEKSMEFAEELGCRAVVFHTNYITGFKSFSYRDQWVKENAEYYHKLISDHPSLNVFVENMFDDSPELIRRLAEEMKDERRFGLCFDFAHAYLWDYPIEYWLKELGPYIRHVHANDNMKDEDSHLPVGDGSIPWNDIDYGILKKNRASFLIEVNSLEKVEKSLKYLKKNKIYIF